jgi:hypothetical protein
MHGYPFGTGELPVRAERGLLQTVLRCALHAGAAAVPAALALSLVVAGRAHAQAPAAEPATVGVAAEQPSAPVVLAAAAVGADSADKVAAARKAPSKRAVKPRAHTRTKTRPVTSAAKPAAKPTKFPAGWPVGPTPLPGAILPNNRIVAYYGNPYSKRMGILGELSPEAMLAHLEATAAKWAAADPETPVKPALHLIVTVAQGQPGSDNMYRMRHTPATIDKVAAWAEQKGWLLFLDIQVGHSTVQAELPRLLPYLARPYVHLALDPEFAMKNGVVPGRKIGTMDAAEVNHAVDALARLVDSLKLPPKVLVVHRFTEGMLTNARRIKIDPRVQVVIDMDGFGTKALKRAIYEYVVVEEPVQFAGFKLFTKAKNDKPMMSPQEVLQLSPQPLYIQYQ